MSLGVAYVSSMAFLILVVATVYSAAQEAELGLSGVLRQSLRRAGKLCGVLAVLAIAVFFLSRV